jgi:NADPH:quinone reductase-like Zn-dependent oxidoreductase
MTRAVVATAYGGPEVLAVIETAAPVPGPGAVAVAVRAAGVNPVDIKRYRGVFGTDPAAMPMRLGAEAAGVVSAVGADVTSVSVGDEVIAYDAAGRGITEAYTTDLVVPVAALTAKPAALSWPAAAGLMLTGAAATHAVTAAGLDAADTLLIHAASGGVGLMAVQLARARGATVIGTAPPAAHDLLREFGVVPVVYGPGLADRVRAAAPDGVTAALDLVGTDEAVDVSLELVADRRRIVTIAAFGRAADAGIVLLGGGPRRPGRRDP